MGADHPIAWLHTQGGGRFLPNWGMTCGVETPFGRQHIEKPFAGLPEKLLKWLSGSEWRIASP